MAKCRELLNKGLLQDIFREQMWVLSEVREKVCDFQKLPLDKSHFITEVPYSSEGLDAQLIEVLRQKECRELHDTIFADLYEKNSRWYEAVTVSYTLDKPQKEVAEKMGISVDTLYSTVYRAKQWIKKYYEEQFHQLDGK